MPGSSISSTWTLLLVLIPLCICLSDGKICKAWQLTSLVQKMGDYVKHCSEDCSLVQITDQRCGCFTLNVTKAGSTVSDYFLAGLRSLNSDIGNQEPVVSLIMGLDSNTSVIRGCFEMNSTYLNINYEPVLSPKGLHVKLTHLSQQIRNYFSAKSRT